jgi:hypothetical protein
LRTSLPVTAVFAFFAFVGSARADRVDELTRALTTDPSWRVRLQAAVVLGRMHEVRATPALIRALGDSSEMVRGLAAQVLGDLDNPQAATALERLRNDPSPFVREKVTDALGKLHPTPVARPAPPTTKAPPQPGRLHVQIGGVGNKAHRGSPELTRRLREFITRELESTPGLTVDRDGGRGYQIDSAITEVSRRTTSDWVEISCEVSFIVGRLPSRAMVMMTSGGATVQAPKASFRPERAQALEVDALEGAVHGAHENLLAFLKTQQ